MPRNNSINKIMIIGSGPIIIGQAAEFDYSGTQACKAIREEGIETILVNSNPATIMTDPDIADKVYLAPLTEEFLEKIIEAERPDAILAGFGGQTGLNLSMGLEKKGILDKFGVRLLGVNKESIQKAEDREAFKELMLEINEPIPPGIIATQYSQCQTFVKEKGYPVIIRPAYTLGGTGGGIATNEKELKTLCLRGMESSTIGQILLEKSIAGWKEIEYEVMRDAKDNCIIICSMENFDPVGVHTGDSIVIAPAQTLNNQEYQMLRDASLKIIRSLKIEGGCNIQFALNPQNSDYCVIEVNPRVSRSSALASKAVGYPISKISAKIALGYTLDELKNYVTLTTSACFEPTLDYCVVKVPKFSFDKFLTATRTLGTQMKATGEVMGISNSFESALLKALTSLEGKYEGLRIEEMQSLSTDDLFGKIALCDDERIFALAELLRRGVFIEQLYHKTGVDPWFLNGLKNITDIEHRLAIEDLGSELLSEAEAMGFTDREILELTRLPREAIQDIRIYHDIFPVYKMVDTCAGEFEAVTPYYYSCYAQEDESRVTDKMKILVVGSGPIRIGQGIEFDYCCVHGVWAIQDAGYEAIIINNNPATVSTDFDISDKLYFEPLHIDDVMNVVKRERPEGVIIQFGGQTALNLAEKLSNRSIKLLGTPYKYIDIAEDRGKFSQLLTDMAIPVPKGYMVTTMEEARTAVEELGYPLVVRPSYVIGGRAMQVVESDSELEKYLTDAVLLSTDHPVLIDQYIMGKEVEVDAVADGEQILIPGIMEHVERTGIHSGDSISVYPSFTLPMNAIDKIIDYTQRIAKALHVVGLVNIQYAYDGVNIYVIEVNPRASRTVPILSKVTGIPMIKLAVSAMLGSKLEDMGYGVGLCPSKDLYAVKVPVFSGEKLSDIDVALGPEMRSTGEVLGLDRNLKHAFYKGFCAAGITIPTQGAVYASLRNSEKNTVSVEIIKAYEERGFKIWGSDGTCDFLRSNGISTKIVTKSEVLSGISNKDVVIIINVPERVNQVDSRAFDIRRKATDHRLPVLTCMDTAKAFLYAIEVEQLENKEAYLTVDSLESF